MTFNFKNLKFLKSKITEKSYMVSLRNSQEFLAVLRRYGRIISRALFPRSKVSSRLQVLTKLGHMLLRLTKHHGPTYVVKYLKALTVCLQRYLGGQPLKSLREIEPNLPLPRLTSSGLPNFIPLRDRREIEKLTVSVVRWYLTIFSIYRIISCPGQLKLSTITDPYTGSQEALDNISTWFLTNSKKFVSIWNHPPKLRASQGLERIQKASASSSVSWQGWLVDVVLLKEFKPFHLFCSYGQQLLYNDWFSAWKGLVSRLGSGVKPEQVVGNAPYPGLPLDPLKIEKEAKARGVPLTVPRVPKKLNPYLGQLALKEEAAGKVRVFAMVDIWTQSLLKPLHNWLFDLFRLLPNDGTHDQDAAFRRAQVKAVEAGQAYCYDLSAATDRLPLKLQIAILDSIFSIKSEVGSEVTFGQAWAQLLTDRDYWLLKSQYVEESISVRYAVGQPMGALSSWAMLNLCHHLILQMINYTLTHKVKWYTNYEVLGDDIVIFDREVADRYFEIMESKLGVKCNKAKSLLSPDRPVIEFAKRVSIGLNEVSPLSWRQLRSLDSIAGRASIATDWLTRKFQSHPVRVLDALTGAKWGLVSTKRFALLHFVGSLVNKGVLTVAEFSDLIMDRKNPMRYYTGRIIENIRVKLFEDIVVAVMRGQPVTVPKSKAARASRLHAGLVRGYLEDRVIKTTWVVRDLIKFGAPFGFQLFFHDLCSIDLLRPLFYPGNRYRDKIPKVDLNVLSERDLVERLRSLEQLRRDILFYKEKPSRKLEVDNHLRLMNQLERAKREGLISIEIKR